MCPPPLDNCFKRSTPFKNSHNVSLITVSVNGVNVLKLLSGMAILVAVFVLLRNVVSTGHTIKMWWVEELVNFCL